MIVGRSTLRCGIINPRIFKFTHLRYSTSTENVKKEEKSPEQAKKEAAELAMQSIKDLGGLFLRLRLTMLLNRLKPNLFFKIQNCLEV